MPLRHVEPTRVCSRCKQRKPYSDFHARTRRPDGFTVVTVQSRCKLCDRAYRREWAAANPERMRKYWRDDYARVSGKAEHGKDARRRERAELLSADPFRAWLGYLLRREDDRPKNPTAMALNLRMSPRSVRRILSGSQRHVTLDLVERAIGADGTTTLRELYE
jgi:hypothetical protein